MNELGLLYPDSPEKAIVSTILNDHAAIPIIAGQVAISDFSSEFNRIIAQSAYDLCAAGESCTFDDILGRLSKSGHMGSGIGSYMGHAVEEVVSRNISYDAAAMKVAATRRIFFLNANEIVQCGKAQDWPRFTDLVKRFADKARLYNDIATDWEGDPISLDKPEPPSFGEEDFPPGLWDKLKAVSQALEVPIELPATQGLAVLAAACQKRFVIQVEPGYTEPLNLWPCCALEPANRKSPSLKNMAAPLASWEIDRSRDMGPEIERCTLEYKAQSARLKKLEKDYGAADDPAEREKIFATLSELSKSIKPIPMPPQIFTQDTSPEKLAVLLENNHEKMAIFSAEGGIFDIISGRYSNGMPNLDIFLQAHSGDAVRVDRVGRSGVYLKEPALTMGLSPQPDVIRSLADRQGFKGRGFIARFLFALPRSNVGQRTLEPKPLSAYVEEQYARTIRALLDYVNEVPLIIHLSQKAYDSWKTFQLTVEMEMGENGDLAGMKDFGGKLPGAAARIAGLFHCYIHAHNGPQVERVSFATMSAALSLAGKLSAHTRTVYDLMGVDPDIEDARRMLNWIVKESKHRFTLRECHRALQGSFSRKEALEPALKVLTERGYIRLMARPSTQGPGRPSIIYEVHPLIIRK